MVRGFLAKPPPVIEAPVVKPAEKVKPDLGPWSTSEEIQGQAKIEEWSARKPKPMDVEIQGTKVAAAEVSQELQKLAGPLAPNLGRIVSRETAIAFVSPALEEIVNRNPGWRPQHRSLPSADRLAGCEDG